MIGEKPTCEQCGQLARVHISDQVPGKGKVMRHLCLPCAERTQQDAPLVETAAAPPLSEAAVFLATGAFVTTLSASADYVRLGEQPGFGWYQIAAIFISIVLFLAGVVMRATSITLIALLMGGLTLFADWIKVGHVEGFGWHQRIGTATGVALMLWGLWLARRRRKGNATRPAPSAK
ncbi:MAG: hypothetical protein IT449_09110 [Phycisphaerales bacterium]|nr:hypothetical protein [Phycisphaerales bacterium]